MPKKYGEYSGSLKNMEKYLQNCTQLELFLILLAKHKYITGFCYNYINDSLDNALEEIYGYIYAITQTQRFGVKLPKINGELVDDPGDSYITWYEYCYDYYHSHFTFKEQNKIEMFVSLGQDISKYEIPRIEGLLQNVFVRDGKKKLLVSSINGKVDFAYVYILKYDYRLSQE